jgi:sugar phosphate isomerase/epimerase
MKLCVSNLFWSNNTTIDVFYSKLKKLGIRYLEIAPRKTFLNFPYYSEDETKKELNKLKVIYNLEVVSIQSIWFGIGSNIFSSNEEKELLLKKTKEIIYFAGKINCKNIIFGNPSQRNGYSPIYEKSTIKFFQDIGSFAKEHKVNFLLEPNPKIYNTNFLNNNIETIEFIKKVNHPNILLNLDLGSMISNNENIKDIKKDLNLIKHLHISEPFLKPIIEREIHKEISFLGLNTYFSLETLNIDDLNLLELMIKYLRGAINFND